MTEDLLQYIWKNQLFDTENLITQEREPLEIIHQGVHNSDAGPDFLDARIKIGDTVWAGNVEIHTRSSDWRRHRHNSNRAYDNVILHVVLFYDSKIKRTNGTEIPTFCLTIKEQLQQRYSELLKSNNWLACSDYIHKFDRFWIKLGLGRLMIERLQGKVESIEQSLKLTKNNWNESFYRSLAHNFGFRTNAQPFETLAINTPLLVLAKHKKELKAIESILFGQAGLLADNGGDDYYQILQREYQFLARKLRLKPIDQYQWKFMRMRPASFPTIRIAQFAALIHQSDFLFSKLLNAPDVDYIRLLFDVTPSDYWRSHYRFNSVTPAKSKRLGRLSVDGIIINTVIPYLFAYAELQNKQELKDRALSFLENLPPERNTLINQWQHFGLKAENAFETQALLQLRNQYCNNKRCLNCRIGRKVVN